jgi:NAD(P)-dependent dehydrogenase (short-subunit alcohol dehydrogenase family)
MRKNKTGRIINISSVSAQIGLLGQANYSASKSAIVGFTKTLSNENANLGITVNCISSGFIDTEMLKTISKNILDNYIEKIPMKKIGTIESVAHCYFFNRK